LPSSLATGSGSVSSTLISRTGHRVEVLGLEQHPIVEGSPAAPAVAQGDAARARSERRRGALSELWGENWEDPVAAAPLRDEHALKSPKWLCALVLLHVLAWLQRIRVCFTDIDERTAGADQTLA
jgi:hypothetical protein